MGGEEPLPVGTEDRRWVAVGVRALTGCRGVEARGGCNEGGQRDARVGQSCRRPGQEFVGDRARDDGGGGSERRMPPGDRHDGVSARHPGVQDVVADLGQPPAARVRGREVGVGQRRDGYRDETPLGGVLGGLDGRSIASAVRVDEQDIAGVERLVGEVVLDVVLRPLEPEQFRHPAGAGDRVPEQSRICQRMQADVAAVPREGVEGGQRRMSAAEKVDQPSLLEGCCALIGDRVEDVVKTRGGRGEQFAHPAQVAAGRHRALLRPVVAIIAAEVGVSLRSVDPRLAVGRRAPPGRWARYGGSAGHGIGTKRRLGTVSAGRSGTVSARIRVATLTS